MNISYAPHGKYLWGTLPMEDVDDKNLGQLCLYCIWLQTIKIQYSLSGSISTDKKCSSDIMYNKV